MKTKILFMVAFLFVAVKSYSQFAFSVSPGLSMNSASFGYKMNKFVPFVGFQHFSSGASFEYKYEEFDYISNQIVQQEYTGSYKLALFMPNVGLKYFIKETGNLKAHFSLNVAKPIVTGKLIDDNEENEDIKDALEGISLWGGEFSFGIEYFFDEHFSLGGEFGLRHFRARFKDTQDTEVYNPNTGIYQDSESSYDLKFNMSPTFSKVSLNFYF